MAMVDVLLPEFDREMANTRRYLERVPDGHFAWKPHAKSRSLGNLAHHLATIPANVGRTMDADSLDLSTARPAAAESATQKELLATFDQIVATSRAKLAAATDAQLMLPWTLKFGPKTVFTMPKAAVLRAIVFSHTIHHRGQLGVYLRLKDVPVPAIYGPSADESGM